MEIILFTQSKSPRLNYIAYHLIETLLGNHVTICTDIDIFKLKEGIKINYSPSPITSQEVHILPTDLLFDNGIKAQPLSSFLSNDTPVIFGSPPGYDLEFDIFAASFYILSRYEEYLPYTPDPHGRYPASISWAARNNALDTPILWEWCKLLTKAIQKYYPNFKPTPPGYRFLPSYDIDIPWAFKHRRLRAWVRAGIEFFTGKWALSLERIKVKLGFQQDPYFTFDDLKELHQKFKIPAHFFALLADPTRHDINPSYRLNAYQKLILSIRTWAPIGIHPSYYSWHNDQLIQKEKQRLSDILKEDIKHSRQHFLRMSLPDTYKGLIQAGIQHDYTMAFADAAGYRAGTTEPFRWYDLSTDTLTDLWVHPFSVMEVSLRQYEKLDAAAAQIRLNQLQDYCHYEGLTFSTLWHNSSFSPLFNWEGWWDVYVQLFTRLHLKNK